LVGGYEPGHGIEERCLSASCPSRHEQRKLVLHAQPDQCRDIACQRLGFYEARHGPWVAGEFPDRDRVPERGYGEERGVHAVSCREVRIERRIEHVYLPAYPPRDRGRVIIDHLLVLHGDVGLAPSELLVVYPDRLMRVVHHHLFQLLIREQGFEFPQAQCLLEEVHREHVLLVFRQGREVPLEYLLGGFQEFRFHGLVFLRIEYLAYVELDFGDQLAFQLGLQDELRPFGYARDRYLVSGHELGFPEYLDLHREAFRAESVRGEQF